MFVKSSSSKQAVSFSSLCTDLVLYMYDTILCTLCSIDIVYSNILKQYPHFTINITQKYDMQILDIPAKLPVFIVYTKTI